MTINLSRSPAGPSTGSGWAEVAAAGCGLAVIASSQAGLTFAQSPLISAPVPSGTFDDPLHQW